MQRRFCLAEAFAETSHAEEDWFSGGVCSHAEEDWFSGGACRNKSCRGGLV